MIANVHLESKYLVQKEDCSQEEEVEELREELRQLQQKHLQQSCILQLRDHELGILRDQSSNQKVLTLTFT